MICVNFDNFAARSSCQLLTRTGFSPLAQCRSAPAVTMGCGASSGGASKAEAYAPEQKAPAEEQKPPKEEQKPAEEEKKPPAEVRRNGGRE